VYVKKKINSNANSQREKEREREREKERIAKMTFDVVIEKGLYANNRWVYFFLLIRLFLKATFAFLLKCHSTKNCQSYHTIATFNRSSESKMKQ